MIWRSGRMGGLLWIGVCVTQVRQVPMSPGDFDPVWYGYLSETGKFHQNWNKVGGLKTRCRKPRPSERRRTCGRFHGMNRIPQVERKAIPRLRRSEGLRLSGYRDGASLMQGRLPAINRQARCANVQKKSKKATARKIAGCFICIGSGKYPDDVTHHLSITRVNGSNRP